ncbi:hypothetical protein [Alsobacter metallidurans]|nr:hypothetical protein [Alsobacter metallidurans]
MSLLKIFMLLNAVLVAIIPYGAYRRGLSPFRWFLISVLFTPMIALPVLAWRDFKRQRAMVVAAPNELIPPRS